MGQNQGETMPRFQKRPVIIEAMKLPDAGEEPDLMFLDELHEFLKDATWFSDRDEGIAIETLEGTMRADPGDWIIRGIKGEFYPCKPDIFEASYEKV